MLSGASVPFTANVGGTNWLAVSPRSGTAPGTLIVTVNPSVLASGSYNGTVTLTISGAAYLINVSLTVTTPMPTITGVRNAASGAAGPIAPGEIISIYANAATNPIGPTNGVGLQLDQNGRVATTLGGVQVVFLPVGIYAPLTYVSAGQINAVVPYEVAGVPNPQVEVLYLKQQSYAFALQVAT